MIEQISNDYDWGIVRICTVFDRNLDGKIKSRLIFSCLELVPKGLARPTTSALENTTASNKDGTTLYFRQVVMDVGAAVRWYRSENNEFCTPIPSDIAQNGKFDDVPFIVGELEDDPCWPVLSLHCPAEWPDERSLQFLLPFLPHWNKYPRFHCRFAKPNPDLMSIVNTPKTKTWLRNRLHFDIGEFLEFLGGCFLIAPNPLIRTVRCKLLDDQERKQGRETLLVHLEPLPFAELDQLKISCSFASQVGPTERFRKRVGSKRIFMFASKGVIARSSIEIECPKRGLLYSSPLASFVRNAIVDMHIGQSRKIIISPQYRKENSPDETRQISVFSDAERIEVLSEGNTPSKGSHLLSILARRDRIKHAMRLGQRWLKDPKEAREFIRSTLANAREKAWLFDPYLGDLEITWFAHDVPISADIRLLTSREAFQANSDLDQQDIQTAIPSGDIGRLKTKKERLEHEKHLIASFFHQMRQLRKAAPNQKIEARIMMGSTPVLHDRFMVLDNTVWLIGSSLGMAGQREGVMTKLPDYESAEGELDRIFASSMAFEEFAGPRIQQITRRLEKIDQVIADDIISSDPMCDGGNI